MTEALSVFPGGEARALAGDAYGLAVLAAIERAESRLWSSMFLMSEAPAADSRKTVRQLVDGLVRASLRGVDVKVLLNLFLVQPDQLDANRPAADYLATHGISVRRFVGTHGKSSHSKYLIVDEASVIVGSGNFTPGAMDVNVELALEVRSGELNGDLARRFLLGWALGTERA